MRKLLFTTFFVFTAILSCHADKSQDKFAPGEVVIGFKEYVSGQQALKILDDYNLPIKDIVFSQYTYFFKTSRHNAQNYKRHLLNSRLFLIVETQLSTPDSPFDILFAYCKLQTAMKEVNTLVSGLEGLIIQSVETHAIILSVTVEKGEEEKWIRILKNNPNIESAELNYMAEIAF
ncbi:MAG: hypothetical protein ABIC68_01765 [Candidatus Omnitrophota bacterium]